MSNKDYFVQDERDKMNAGIASQWAFGFIIVFLIGKFIYFEVIRDVANTQFLFWDVLMLVIACIIFITVMHSRKSYDVPRTILGRKLSTQPTKSGRKERILKSYIPETFIFAIGFTIGSYLYSGFNHILNGIVEFLVFFVIFNLINYFWGEHVIRRYNQSLED